MYYKFVMLEKMQNIYNRLLASDISCLFVSNTSIVTLSYMIGSFKIILIHTTGMICDDQNITPVIYLYKYIVLAFVCC